MWRTSDLVPDGVPIAIARLEGHPVRPLGQLAPNAAIGDARGLERRARRPEFDVLGR